MTPAEEHTALTEALKQRRAECSVSERLRAMFKYHLAVLDVLIEKAPDHRPENYYIRRESDPHCFGCLGAHQQPVQWSDCFWRLTVRAATGAP